MSSWQKRMQEAVRSGDPDALALVNHGTRTGYTYGCRCDECREAARAAAGDHIIYSPGSMPEAPDWDGGKAECGGGLHFSSSPAGAKDFDLAATRFLACLIALADIAVHHPAMYPNKVKARAVTAPGCYEVDIRGHRVGSAVAAS